MKQREIIFYKTSENKCPVEEFLDDQNNQVVTKITWTLRILRTEHLIPKKYFKKLVNTDDIWELRVEVSSNIYRIFCFFDSGNLVVLTHGFQKKSQKTPKSEIKKAEKYKKDYLWRKKNG